MLDRHSPVRLWLLLGAGAGLAACARTVLRPVPCADTPRPLPHSALAWQAAPGTPAVVGRVVAVADSGAAGAEVRLTAVAAGVASRRERPGPDGTFRFDSVPPGRYVLEVRRIGHFRVQDTLRVTADSGAAVLAALAWDYATLDACGYVYVPTRVPWWRVR